MNHSVNLKTEYIKKKKKASIYPDFYFIFYTIPLGNQIVWEEVSPYKIIPMCNQKSM